MLADDFLGLVALDALGPLVPVGDVTFGVQHIDRIIGDALHEKTKITLALVEVTILSAAGHTYSLATAANGVGTD